jgi:hypothetical protein
VKLATGETIVDETREYVTWADWVGVLRHTFSAVLGAVIASGQYHRETRSVGMSPDSSWYGTRSSGCVRVAQLAAPQAGSWLAAFVPVTSEPDRRG